MLPFPLLQIDDTVAPALQSLDEATRTEKEKLVFDRAVIHSLINTGIKLNLSLCVGWSAI